MIYPFGVVDPSPSIERGQRYYRRAVWKRIDPANTAAGIMENAINSES